MSWLFGKKKHKESPPDSSEEASTANQSDDYIIIEKQANPFTPNIASNNDNDGNIRDSNPGIYPYLNEIGNSPIFPSSPSASFAQQNILGDSQAYLSFIKCQLNKQFNNDKEIERIHIDEIFSYLMKIKNEEYNYDFGLENSVITEMESTTE